MSRGANADPALVIRDLTKVYRDGAVAVDGLSLEIPDGALFGLLGPNGAGKTTLIGSVCNVVQASSGSISVFGHDSRTREACRLVGLAEQDINIDRFLSIRQVLIYHAGYHGIGRKAARRRADELLELFQLSDKAKCHSHELSGGMQRRLVVARALAHRPRLLILDEPTAGVDVELTTHYLEEADSLCDEIALIRSGVIVDRGSSASLRLRYGARDISEVYSRVITGQEVA
jgi:ABC-2 type transport system ATP-binding protein